jgi:hypothetical protein
LFDLKGNLLNTFLNGVQFAPGKHQMPLRFPEDLPAGPYILRVQQPAGIASVRISKI